MSATGPDLIDQCRQRGITLYLDGQELRFRGPRGAMTPELRQVVAHRRAELVAMLNTPSSAASPTRSPTASPPAPPASQEQAVPCESVPAQTTEVTATEVTAVPSPEQPGPTYLPCRCKAGRICWPCCNRPCEVCGKLTGSAFIRRCVLCGELPDEG